MGRKRTIPDVEVYAAIRQMLAAGGEKAVAFSSVARATGLAAPTLVQRYGSRDEMLRAALLAAWDQLDERTSRLAGEAPMTAKGAAQLLKALPDDDGLVSGLALLAADFRDEALRERALRWRRSVQAALAQRLGTGARGREASSILFAAWQGQLLWAGAGGPHFKLKDAIKRLA